MLTTTFFFIAIVIIGSLISFIIQVSHIDDNSYGGKVFNPPTVIGASQDSIVIDDKLDHLMWFMQISDIHLSKIFDQKRIADFNRFTSIVVDSVRPSVVLATGDLTDSRSQEPLGSDQYEQEWKWYDEALKSGRITEKTIWLDMRGNHDAFNVHSWNASNNYYRKYTHRGNQSSGHYIYTITKGSDVYNFLGIDACPQPAPRRPFNFLGFLKKSDLDSVKALIQKAPKPNMTIFFGHYPTSSIMDEGSELRNTITGPYLCGHFHTFAGLVPKMYATQSTGYLEIEVGDWKDERIFRVAAVDHGLFSFVDVKLDLWPIILVTNPKSAVSQMPRYEPIHRISNSTHIRVLAFSPSPIDSVLFRINDESWVIMTRASKTQPLFTYPWNPEKYSSGLHTITVRASDENGHTNTQSVQFSIDKSKPEFPFGARLLLRVSTRSFLQGICMFLVCVAIFPLFTMRFIVLIEKGSVVRSRARFSFIYKIYFKFLLLAANDKFFIALTFIPVYALLGPWFIGDLLDNHLGVCFAWGMYIDGNWIPIALPYLFGSFNIILFHIPLVTLLSHNVHKRYLELSSKSKDSENTIWHYLKPRHIIFLIMVIFNILFNFQLSLAYGFKSLLLGFEHFWSKFIYLYVWWATFSLTLTDFKITEPKKNDK